MTDMNGDGELKEIGEIEQLIRLKENLTDAKMSF